MSNNTDLKFKFNNLNILKAKKILKKYPKKFSQSAIIPLLHLAQEQLDGWLNKSSIEYISKYLKLPLINVYEVATFYHMFNLKKVGKNCIGVCTTTPCWLRGSDVILKKFEEDLNIYLLYLLQYLIILKVISIFKWKQGSMMDYFLG